MSDFNPYYEWLGIPPQDQPADHYRLLGLSKFESNPTVIANAADRQIAHLRLFQAGPRGQFAPALIDEVMAARACLLSPEQRQVYDESLRTARVTTQPTTPLSTVQVRARRPLPRQKQSVIVLVSQIVIGGLVGIFGAAVILQYVFHRDPLGLWGRPELADSPPASIEERTELPPQETKANEAGSSAQSKEQRIPVQQTPVNQQPTDTSPATTSESSAASSSPSAPTTEPESTPTPLPIPAPAATSGEPAPPIPRPLTREERLARLVQERQKMRERIERYRPVSAVQAKTTEDRRRRRGQSSPQYILRFSDRSFLELTGTESIPDVGRDFTFELWIRWKTAAPAAAPQYLGGNEVWQKMHPKLSSHRPLGWVLRTSPTDDGMQFDFTIAVQRGKWQNILSSPVPVDTQWHHVAAVKAGKQVSVAWDGKFIASEELNSKALTAPLPCYIGPRKFGFEERCLDADIRTVRIASIARYQSTETFEPPADFASDEHTLVLLDFSKGDASDRSNHGHHGITSDLDWVWLPVDHWPEIVSSGK